MASRLVVSVSTATTPASRARAIHSVRRASVRTVSYLLRSILAWRAASLRAVASAIGVSAPLPCLPPPDNGSAGAAIAGATPARGDALSEYDEATDGLGAASTWVASKPLFSATRWVSVLNPIDL